MLRYNYTAAFGRRHVSSVVPCIEPFNCPACLKKRTVALPNDVSVSHPAEHLTPVDGPRMIQKTTDQARADVAVLDIPCPDFPVTWAGRGRHDEFCFGSEDGRLRFTTLTGGVVKETPFDQEHSEAVNGVAFSGSLIAVSSRSELVFWDVSQWPGAQARPAPLYCGSHDVISTGSSYFVAPLGPNGVMMVRAIAEQGQPIKRIRSRDELLDFYKVLCLDTTDGEVLVCAVRKTGIATIEWLDGAIPPLLNLVVPHELDVIDVCSLATTEAPRAIAGLCRDGTMLFFNDILDGASGVARRSDELRGTAYRILSAENLVIILTSRGLYVLPRIALQAPQDKSAGIPPISGIVDQLDAIDLNLVGDRWLLAAMPECVRRYDVNSFLAQARLGQTQGDSVRETAPVATMPVSVPFHFTETCPHITSRTSPAEEVGMYSAA